MVYWNKNMAGPEWTHVDVDPRPLVGADGSKHNVDVICDARKIRLPPAHADLAIQSRVV